MPTVVLATEPARCGAAKAIKPSRRRQSRPKRLRLRRRMSMPWLEAFFAPEKLQPRVRAFRGKKCWAKGGRRPPAQPVPGRRRADRQDDRGQKPDPAEVP